LEAIQKIKQETYRGKEKIANKGEFSAKKRDVIKHIQDQLYQLEAEQNEMLEREAEVLKVELEENMQNEKAVYLICLFNHSPLLVIRRSL